MGLECIQIETCLDSKFPGDSTFLVDEAETDLCIAARRGSSNWWREKRLPTSRSVDRSDLNAACNVGHGLDRFGIIYVESKFNVAHQGVNKLWNLVLS